MLEAADPWTAAHDHLAAGTGPLAALVREHGPMRLSPRRNRFEALVASIVSQQLSTRAASTIMGRVISLVPDGFAPGAVAALPDEVLRGAGLSRAKSIAVRAIGTQVRDGATDLDAFDTMEDAAIIGSLVALHGVGAWTAQMYLIFALNRPDVLATTDLGIQVAAGRALGLATKATPIEVATAAQAGAWHPYATVACLHLWRSLVGPAGL